MTIKFERGAFNVSASDRTAIEDFMRQTAAAGTREAHDMMAAAITRPISQVAAYEEWLGDVFVQDTIGLNEDSKIPLDTYEIQAFFVSSDGQAMPVRLGWVYTDMTFFRIEAAFEIHVDDLARATWPILQDKIQRVGEELARKRDQKRRTALLAAANAIVGHRPTITGGSLGKTGVDAIFKTIARVGFKLDKVKVNSADVLDMRTWSGSNTFAETEGIAGDLIRRGYLGEYGGANWQTAIGCPGYVAGTQNGEVYFLAASNQIGYERYKGSLRSLSDTNARRKINGYYYDQSLGIIVANNYGVWIAAITA